MSIVLPLPQPMSHHTTPPLLPRTQALSPTRSSPSPARLSRPSTPPNLKDLHSNALSSLQPISAPPTPVTPTHFFNLEPESSRMERCRSSEAAIGVQTVSILESADGRDSRRRDVKATSLLFKTVPSKEQIHTAEKGESYHLENPVEIGQTSTKEERPAEHDDDDKMDIDGEQPDLLSEGAVAEKMAHMQEEAPPVWGMPRWGWEEQRMEVRKGVRLVGMEELPGLVEQHNMLDVPSQVLFPWLHGIADDGKKGRDMAAFFGHAPPFEPPPYRGLCLLLAPPHPLDSRPNYPRLNVMQQKPQSERTDSSQPEPQTPISPSRDKHEPRERSETMSTSSESYVSSNETDMTSPSISEFQPQTPDTPARPPHSMEPEVVVTEDDVQMHPCESMRPSPAAKPKGLEQERQSLPWETSAARQDESSAAAMDSSDDDEHQNTAPSCIFANALHAQDVFEFPDFTTDAYVDGTARFRSPRLPHHINLRNLNIQQIKYATISDIILYAKNGAGAGVLQIAEMIADSQERLYQERLQEFYVHQKDRQAGEGMAEPVRYGVWVLVEPFHKVEKLANHLVNLDSKGTPTDHAAQTDLFERESIESRAMTKASEVVEGFWVGNEFDVPAINLHPETPLEYDVLIRASETLEMPSSSLLSRAHKQLLEVDKRRESNDTQKHSWVASPATIALRNLLSPGNPGSPLPDTGTKRSSSPTDETTPTKLKSRKSRSADILTPVYLQCSGSCRTFTGQMRNLTTMTDRVVELVYFLRKLVEGRDSSGIKRKILIYCQDGYTESSIIVLAYIMSSLSISLPEAYLHLQVNAKRSFFLYPSDKPLLRKVDARLAADRKAQALKLISSPSSPGPSSPTSTSSPSSPLSSRWKAWGFGVKDTAVSTSTSTTSTTMTTTTANAVVSGSTDNTVDVARQMLAMEEKGGSKESQDARVWFDDKRFDGFPSRILDFLYLGNLEHAGNAAMLHALGMTHVVSVGESLISCPVDCDPMYGQIGTNTLSAEAAAGRIQVLDLADIRDDGNDPLRPLIARACGWIEEARQNGGVVLVHCRVGVSRSASIVMAYMMQHKGLGLMDAYLLTRARRLNVLIQPNLRFFHELFGWEVELAKAELKMIQLKREEMERNQIADETEIEALKKAEEGRRKIYYSWPSFCRDLHCLNRRFLCN